MPATEARRWSRGAWTAAVLFASVPLAGRLVLGTWGFFGAAELACASLLAGIYLHLRERRHATMPDPATLLDRAHRLALAGKTDRAIAILSKAIRVSPWLWQAYQYRGELRLGTEGAAALAEEDFEKAIRLAPAESHLYRLLEHARENRENRGENRGQT